MDTLAHFRVEIYYSVNGQEWSEIEGFLHESDFSGYLKRNHDRIRKFKRVQKVLA